MHQAYLFISMHFAFTNLYVCAKLVPNIHKKNRNIKFMSVTYFAMNILCEAIITCVCFTNGYL